MSSELEKFNLEIFLAGRKRIILRDDQISWLQAMDLAKFLRARKRPFILLDTGNFSLAELEWLVSQETIIFSYHEAGRTWADLLMLRKGAKRQGGFIIYAYRGNEAEKNEPAIYNSLRQLGRGGIDLHLSGREKIWKPEDLSQLAADCHRGRGWLIYYHYGPIETWLNQLAREGAWLHFTDRFFNEDQIDNLEDLLQSFRRGQVRLVLHLEKHSSAELVEFVFERGGILVFPLPPPPSLLMKLDRMKRKLPFRAYHLEPKAMF